MIGFRLAEAAREDAGLSLELSPSEVVQPPCPWVLIDVMVSLSEPPPLSRILPTLAHPTCARQCLAI